MNRIEHNRQIYQKVSARTSRYVTHEYSTSFSLSIFLLHRDLRAPIRGIYGFVRLTDELVDTFHNTDQSAELQAFKDQTYQAIRNRFSSNPILHYFQQVVHEYQLDESLIEAFFHSMEMDLHQNQYDRSSFEEYIYGSAEVVGLMCLHVFCEGDRNLYEDLKPYALKLGAAYQKVNFLRDLGEDMEELNRTYFPQFDRHHLDRNTKNQIEEEIESDFNVAYRGITRLPIKAKFGVYVSYLYYRRLFQKIKQTSPDQMLNRRIRISNVRKGYILCEAYMHHKLNQIRPAR